MTPDAAAPMPWLDAAVEQALAMDQAHALLLHGAPGDGLFACAQSIVQAWLCEVALRPARRACGVCAACRAVPAGSHADLHRLLPESLRQQLGVQGAGAAEGTEPNEADGSGKSRKKPSRQIRVDEVRSAIDWIVKTSSRGGAKVVLVHPSEALNVQAANALLKTLEEPPRGARLLLTAAEPHHLLPTVRSRCQVVRLRPPSAADAQRWLSTQGLDQAQVLLAACSNRPLDALAMATEGIDAARWTALPAAVMARQPAAFSGWSAARVLDALQKLCHDGLCIASGGQARFFAHRAMQPAASVEHLAQWSRSLASLSQRIDHPWNEGLLLEALLQQAHAAWTGSAEQSDTLGL